MIDLRKAEEKDCLRIYNWRNSELCRQFSNRKDVIAYDHHERWYKSAIKDPDREFLICNYGVVRFDIEDNEAEVSIFLNPEFYGKGLGGDLLKAAERWLFIARGKKRVVAQVLPENIASLKLFSKSGYLFFKDLGGEE